MSQNVSVDEVIVKGKGTNSVNRYLPIKPNNFEVKSGQWDVLTVALFRLYNYTLEK